MTTNTQFFNVSTLGDVADHLGDARAALSDAKKQVEFFEGLLKQSGETVVEGQRYRVAISYGVETITTAWKTIAQKFKPSRQLIAAHTKSSTSDRIRVSSLIK